MLRCPAAALYDTEPETSTALTVGQYVDTALTEPKKLPAFELAHPEIFKRDGSPRAEYVKAAEMIARAKADPVFMEYMAGRKQVIKTGQLDGIPFRVMMDVYRKGERIVDLKTARDLKPGYIEGVGRVTFADVWDWPLQMAIYQHIEGGGLPCFLAVVTKEDPPDLAVVEISQTMLDYELDRLRKELPRLDAIRRGVIEAPRCERCAYCRRTKKLKGPRPLAEFI